MSLKLVIWLGDSRESVRLFPLPIKEEIGFQLFQLQQGGMPLRSRPMKSIGSGVYELKEQDHHGWFRVIYALHVKNRIYVLHCFKKQSAKTSRDDLDLAKKRLRKIQWGINYEKE